MPIKTLDELKKNIYFVGKELLWIIFLDSKKHLKPGGKFYVVTISGLKEFIKRNFKEVFGNYEKLGQNKTHTVALAINDKLPYL